MTYEIKHWLENAEAAMPIDRSAQRKLKRKLFPRSRASWFVTYGLGFGFAAALIAVTALLPSKNSASNPLRAKLMTAQEVLAASETQLSNVQDGTLSMITRQIHFSGTVYDHPFEMTTSVTTDGTRYLTEESAEDQTTRYWTEKNPDGLTITEYAFVDGYDVILRDLNGSDAILVENMTTGEKINPRSTDIPETESTPDTALLDYLSFSTDSSGNATSASFRSHNLELKGTVEEHGVSYYHIVSTDAGHFMGSATSVVREFWIRQDTLQLTKRTWNVVLTDGKTSMGELDYTYRSVKASDLDHPFTLEWWLASIDPEGMMEINCSAYGYPCAEASTKTDAHDVMYVPPGWMDDARLGSRMQRFAW